MMRYGIVGMIPLDNYGYGSGSIKDLVSLIISVYVPSPPYILP